MKSKRLIERRDQIWGECPDATPYPFKCD